MIILRRKCTYMFINEILNASFEKENIEIVLIAHVRNPRGYDNKLQLHCSETEKFSVDEFYEIYKGIVNAGYFIKATFFNELDFIKEYLDSPTEYKNILVFNLSRNGLSINKKTLIPAFCDLVSIPYTTSGSFACSLARNKHYFNNYLKSKNVKVPKTWDTLEDMKISLKSNDNKELYVIRKPAAESASQGLDKNSILTMKDLCDYDFLQDYNGYIYQEYIDGYECEVPIFKYGNRIVCMDPVGIDLKDNIILTYDNSFIDNYDFFDLNEKLDSDIIELICNEAINIFQLLDMEVYGRIDFRISSEGEPFVFDISTTPYITKHSSFSFAFNKAGFKHHDIFDVIIKSALNKNNKY